MTDFEDKLNALISDVKEGFVYRPQAKTFEELVNRYRRRTEALERIKFETDYVAKESSGAWGQLGLIKTIAQEALNEKEDNG